MSSLTSNLKSHIQSDIKKNLKNKLKIVIGDKNLSSWSMRPWLVLKASGLPFREEQILLDRPSTKARLAKVSPSGRVPVLYWCDVAIWDSLAISELIAELAPDAELWPGDAVDRAVARSYVAEMHSGFSALRDQLSMTLSLRMTIAHLSTATISDIHRILHLWREALGKSKGPFLFGKFGIVDAFYAPVVFRFLSYGIAIKDRKILRYMEFVQRHPAVVEWVNGAQAEKPWIERF